MQRSYSAVVRFTIDGLPDTDDVALEYDKAKKLVVGALTTTADSAVKIENVVVDTLIRQ